MSPPQEPGDVGPADQIDRAWEKKAEELELDSLANVRALAEKWSAALGTLFGLLGIGALLEGVDLFKDLAGLEETAKILFFSGSVCGIVATGLAIRATMGPLGVLARPGSGSLASYSRREVNRALNLLTLSRAFLLVAVLAVSTSAGFLMFGSRDEPSPEATEISITGCESLAPTDSGLDDQETNGEESPAFIVSCN